MYAIDNQGIAPVAFWHAALLVLLLFATTALGQREAANRLPPSSVTESESSFTELKENLALMQHINEDLLRAISSTSSPDYVAVATNAFYLRGVAIRVMRNLALRRNAGQSSPETPMARVSADDLKAAIVALDMSIRELLKDPVLTRRRIIDAGQPSNARENLEAVMERSVIVQKAAEILAVNSGKDVTKEKRRIKSRLIPSTSIQLSLECSAWSMSDLLKRPSQIKSHGSVNIGAKVKTNRHRLDEKLLLPIDDCVDRETYEKAITDKAQYVAIVTDFTSYEVKGRVFAYRVTYEIGFTRNARVAIRFPDLITFYYVDDAGDGSFELLQGPVSSGLLPDWAAELARKH